MSAIGNKDTRTNPRGMTRFWAIVRYELLWNIRKKKFLGMIIVAFALATLGLALPVILNNIVGRPLSQNPDYAISSGTGAFGFFLFALVTAMNSISGEFESGTIVPLLTKPVSRTLVFLGKLFASFIILLSTYTVLFLYTTIGGTIIYGPQNNLQLVPLVLFGDIVSTLVWVAIVLAIGSISKSSLLAALGAFGIFMALLISVPIISAFSDQAWTLNYVPGNGVSGTLRSISQVNQTRVITEKFISTGTNNIGTNLITYILNPTANVTFYKFEIQSPSNISQILSYSEPLSLVVVRTVAVASIYIITFMLIALYAFKRAQIVE
jgi:ABC-type transport system involved in multi-copper enzyme maturation permease subunit